MADIKIKNPLLTLVVAMIIFNCFAIFILFPIDYMSGAYPNGLFRYMEGNIPFFHVVAEFLMAIITLAGLVGWLKKMTWGKGVTLMGLGMFCYSAINGMGWALNHNPILTVPLILTIVLTLLALPYLLKLEKEERLELPEHSEA